jgi:hypothetical protein
MLRSERSLRCVYFDASGHGEKVVATHHVTLGNCLRSVTVTISQDLDTL